MKRYIFALLFCTMGCAKTEADKLTEQISFERAKMRLETEKQSRKNCLDNGGSVIENSWDWTMKDCKFPYHQPAIRGEKRKGES